MSDKRCNVAVLASGTGTNFRAIAESCQRETSHARVVCLITDNPTAGALSIAESYGIDAHTIEVAGKKGVLPEEQEAKITAVCKDHDVDLITLAGFMRILKGPLLDEFEGRIMNIHPSLLPSFRGLHAARQAFDHGVKIAGCTVHFVDRSLDGGPIILQAAVEVDDDDSEAGLLDKIHEQEHRIYAQAVDLFARDKLEIDGKRVKVKTGR